MEIYRIISANAIDNQTLIIQFSNNEFKKYDISQLLDKPIFSPLKNPAFFKNFMIEPGGYGLVWNEDIDLSEHELWHNGISLKKDETNIHQRV
jgi:hypothetical protein